MEDSLINWILNNLEQHELTGICEKINPKIPGFRNGNFKNVPKSLIISKLKNKKSLLKIVKLTIDISKEETEFKGKNINEIKKLIDVTDKKKFLRQIIYLASSDEEVCNNLANNLIGQIDKVSSYIAAVNQESYDNLNQSYDKYIVTVKYENGFYNIYPLYKIEKGSFIPVDNENEYPNYGNININPYIKFSEKNYKMDSFLICKFNQDDLEENNNKTKFKINGDKLIENNNIYDLKNEKIYEISELIEDMDDLSNFIYINKIIDIKNKPIRDEIYIKDNNYIYGPFGYKSHNMGGGYYIDRSKNNYIVNKYPIKDNENYLNIEEIDNQYSYNSYIKVVYFHNTDNLIFNKMDTITNEQLLDNLKQIISAENISYDKSEIQNIRDHINSIVDNSLSDERRSRIKNLIRNTETTENFIENDLTEIITLLLDDESKGEKITNKILENNDILRKLQKGKLIISKLEDAKKELDDIQLKIKSSKNNILDDNIKFDIKKKENLEKEIEELSKKMDLYGDIDGIIQKKEKLNEDLKTVEIRKNIINEDNQKLNEENHKLEDKAKQIKESLDQELKHIMDQYTDVAFDGIIADEILKSAAEWNKKRNNKKFKSKVASRESFEEHLKVKSFKNQNIIDYIYGRIKKVRNYSRNDIINIMICLTQGFLTIFAGEPGVGKTSLCNIIANSLGLYRKEEEEKSYNRYTEVSVEKGWTSKRDLIGYYNPLTKSFDKNNRSLFNIFNILDYEYKNKITDFPYYILLDEANLSSMEYYWADFMNVCDINVENRKINLGEDYVYNIPKTLRFLATINYDHTTEMLSPRLIDRAWVILLDSSNDNNILYDDDLHMEINDDIVMFKDLEECFENSFTNAELPDQIYSSLKEIYKMFMDNNMSISPRIKKIISMYLKVGINLFEETNDVAQEFIGLDYAVAQKLLPKINGQGEDYKKFLEKIKDFFENNNMIKCEKIVKKIISKGDNNMQYYQFFS